jgi:toxin ParE1/3/4
MSRRTSVSPEAEADLLAACEWYEEQQSGLGDELRLAFLQAVDAIENSPTFPAIIFSNARRYLMNRFKYHIYYSVYVDSINIVAIVHAHRHPKVWKKLLRSRS